MNWWDNLSDEQIEELKNNVAARGLEPKWMQEVFLNIQDQCLLWWDSDEAEWFWAGTYDTSHVYRLRPDWQRPDEVEEKPNKHSCPRCHKINSDDWPIEVGDEIVNGGCQECWESSLDDIHKAENQKWIDEFHEQRREERRWELFKTFVTDDPAEEYGLLARQADEALAAYYNDKEGAE